MSRNLAITAAVLLSGANLGSELASQSVSAAAPWLSPNAVVAAENGNTLFVSCEDAMAVMAVDLSRREVLRSIPVAGEPSGLAVSQDGSRLYVTCAAPRSKICVLNAATGASLYEVAIGHGLSAPVLSADERFLFVSSRFENCVVAFDLSTRREVMRLPVRREPVAAALTLDGKFLLVANMLPAGRADVDHVAAVLSVIDVQKRRVIKELELPTGSGSLNAIRISPDGKHAVVTHILARFHVPTTQLERGWMNTNAGTIIDLARMEVQATVLLDSVDSGAANPWGLDWSGDGKRLVVAHAGTHDVSVIAWPALLAKLAKCAADGEQSSGALPEVADNLSFLVDLRERVKLPVADRGPRALVVIGNTAYTANFFSDSLTAIDLAGPNCKTASIPLSQRRDPDELRRGEFYFHDAGICFQGWQSCASCHPGDARADGLNWDLLNDGIGNPKNVKSLLLAHVTPPAMSGAVRQSAETAVRAGIAHILFTVQPESVATAMDAWLKSLKPVPSPYLVDGKLSASAARGQKVFAKAECASCHPPGLFTDLESYSVGTAGNFDRLWEKFDTPTLVEVWRTAPYLHDGSAVSIQEVLTKRNPRDQHGVTSNLSEQEMRDLCEYVLSL
jgi:DNA-binding beta-propeller fold protein YncE/cytochrome c553